MEIVLREFHDDDILLLEKWLSEGHVAKWYSPISDWLNELRNRKDMYHWIFHFIAEYKGEAIGFCQYYEYENGGESWHGSTSLDGTYSIDYLIGNRDYLRKGLGSEIISSLVEKISLFPSAARIIVCPEPNNTVSCKALLSNGFEYDEENCLYLLNLRNCCSNLP